MGRHREAAAMPLVRALTKLNNQHWISRRAPQTLESVVIYHPLRTLCNARKIGVPRKNRAMKTVPTALTNL